MQVSPPNEHINVPQWWSRYQPVSYVLESRGGNRAQFIDMVQRCKAVGVEIYVDAIINHMLQGPLPVQQETPLQISSTLFTHRRTFTLAVLSRITTTDGKFKTVNWSVWLI